MVDNITKSRIVLDKTIEVKKFYDSANGFKDLYLRDTSNRFTYFPDFMLRLLNYFKKSHIDKFPSYSRGRIIKVDFGINPGYELSGEHYAIVLNKRDGEKNGVLTVIPLSSKYKSYYIDLKAIVAREVLTCLRGQLEETRKLVDIIKAEKSETDGYLEKLLHEIDHNPSNLDIPNLANKLIEMVKDTSEKVNIGTNQLKHITDLQEKYRDIVKSSYGMIKNITSVSKLRITNPLNRLDPLLTIRASAETMIILDKAIIDTFTYDNQKE